MTSIPDNTDIASIWRRPQFALLRLRPSTAGVQQRSLTALAAMLVLAQLPHVLHLPIWIAALGGALIAARLFASSRPDVRWLDVLLSSLVLTGVAVLSAFLIRWHYGYFVGRDPAVAFLFVLVAAKFAELRRGSDATVLMCLATFLLLTQYFYSQTVIAAIVTLPAVFALGHALAVVRDPLRAAPATQNLKRVGVMLLQGAPLAILLFVVFPRLSGPLWSLPEDGAARSGLSDSMSPGSIGELSRSAEVAFRVEFDGAPPPRHQRYWRGPVFDTFDGQSWEARPIRQQRLPSAGEGEAVAYTVMLQPTGRTWMFALDQATSLPVSSDTQASASKPLARMLVDGQLIANKPVDRVTRYRQRSQPGRALLDAKIPDEVTLHTTGRNSRAIELGRQLAARYREPHAIAAALLQRFSEAPFRYTLRPRLLGNSPVDEFLFDSHEGFCEHYASAFAVVMRAAGIPARVVTGYLGGEMNGDYMIVRQSDAHAWNELWIDGKWQRFDPTGAIAPSRIEEGIGSALDADEPVPLIARFSGGLFGTAQLRWDRMNHAWQRLVVDFDNDSQTEFWKRIGLKPPKPWQLTAAVLAATGIWMSVLLGLPGLQQLRDLMRSRRDPPIERAWRKLEHILKRHALGRGTGETPRAWLDRVADQRPDLAERLSALADDFSRARFSAIADAQAAPSLSVAINALGKAVRARPPAVT